jgi:hypothetical protein
MHCATATGREILRTSRQLGFRLDGFHRLRLIAALTLLLCAAGPACAGTFFVDGRVAASGDGGSWAEAFRTEGEGLTSATAGDEVWVAAGTYEESIVLKSEVALLGGFAGGEVARGERDVEANRTVIDASKVREGEPAYHVVVMDSISSATLDGFTVTGGKAWGSHEDHYGGGI